MTKRGRPTKAQLEAEASYQQLMQKWAAVPKFARAAPKPAPKAAPQHQAVAVARNSLVTPGGSTALRQPVKYTGTAMLGVAQMHKSNAVPIFNADAAVDVSRMRRG